MDGLGSGINGLWGIACTDLNSVCYNSVTEHGQMLGVGRLWAVFGQIRLMSIYCPFCAGTACIRLKLMEAGDNDGQ